MPLPEETFGALNYQLIDECQFDTDRMGKELTEKKVLAQPLNLDVFDVTVTSLENPHSPFGTDRVPEGHLPTL